MVRIYIVQTGRTIWEEQDRVEAVTGAPLSDQGALTASQTAEQLADENVGAIFSSAGEAEKQTAKLLAKACKRKAREHEDLRELDHGLWQGLTAKEIKRRQPRLWKQWNQDPTSVCPPGGETVQDARQRLLRGVRESLKRGRGKPILLVLRPIAAGLLRCSLESGRMESLWTYVSPGPSWCKYDVEPDVLNRASGSVKV